MDDITTADLRERVGMNITEALHASGLTRDEVATRAEISGRQLRKILAGERLSLESLLPVASVLGVDVSKFATPR